MRSVTGHEHDPDAGHGGDVPTKVTEPIRGQRVFVGEAAEDAQATGIRHYHRPCGCLAPPSLKGVLFIGTRSLRPRRRWCAARSSSLWQPPVAPCDKPALSPFGLHAPSSTPC